MNNLPINTLYYLIETLGILAFALSGFMLAKKKDFDIVGIYSVAWITAFGGGTLRDVILDIQPVYWIDHAEYPLLLLLLIIPLNLFKSLSIKPIWLFVPDAIGMSLFAITTAQTAYDAGHPTIIVAILATIVATFGGVIRDSICQEIPIIFQKDSTLYASLAFGGACLFVALQHYAPWTTGTNMLVAAIVTFIFRVLAEIFQVKWSRKASR